jgi:hypothetical protein
MLRLLGRRKREEQRDELLSAYLDGELGAEERRRLETRLTQDATLRAELRALHQTVSLVRELPQVAAPRNFILSESMVARRQPAPRQESQAIPTRPRPRIWTAPVLTAATAVVSLLFVVVLLGDLLLPGIGGLASAPEPMAQSKEIPQLALEAAPTGEGAGIEGDLAPSSTSAPMAAAEVPREEPKMAVEEEATAGTEDEVAPSSALEPPPAGEAPREEPEMAVAEEMPEEIQPQEAPLETGTPSVGGATLTAPAGGGGPTEEATAPTEVPAVGEEPAGRELLDESDMEGLRRLRLPWEVLEIGLGLAAVVLTVTTIRAWRVRRR